VSSESYVKLTADSAPVPSACQVAALSSQRMQLKVWGFTLSKMPLCSGNQVILCEFHVVELICVNLCGQQHFAHEILGQVLGNLKEEPAWH
jgi:hypothetical protein